jgi:hypothetical protein
MQEVPMMTAANEPSKGTEGTDIIVYPENIRCILYAKILKLT